jgi:hypothetical protein
MSYAATSSGGSAGARPAGGVSSASAIAAKEPLRTYVVFVDGVSKRSSTC